MKTLVSALGLFLLAGGSGAQAAVVHSFSGDGIAASYFSEAQPVGFEGYAGAYDGVEVRIDVIAWTLDYLVMNANPVGVVAPVTVGLAVDVLGPFNDRIEGTEERSIYVSAESSVWDYTTFGVSRQYSIDDPLQLEQFSSWFSFFVEGLSYATTTANGIAVVGAAPVAFIVGVDYILNDPLPEVPVPAPALLLLSGLGGAAAFMRRRR